MSQQEYSRICRLYHRLERRLESVEVAMKWHFRVINMCRLSLAAFMKLLHK